MNKNLFKWGLSLLSLSLLAACGNSGGQSTGASTPASSPATDVSTPASSHATGVSTGEDDSHATGLSTGEDDSHATGLSTGEDDSHATGEDSGTVVENAFVVSVNSIPVDVANIVEEGSTNLGVFKLALELGDSVTMKYNDEPLYFAGYNGTAYETGSLSFIAEAEGNYTFYVNADAEVWTVKDKDVSGEVIMDLYVKMAVSDEEALLPAYAWVWTNDTDGTWCYATHIEETWSESGNRHYQASVEDPLNKNVIFAIFSAESGVDEDHTPDQEWTGCIRQSAAAVFKDWGADIYGE